MFDNTCIDVTYELLYYSINTIIFSASEKAQSKRLIKIFQEMIDTIEKELEVE